MPRKDMNSENCIQLTLEDIAQEPECFGNHKDLLDSLSLYGTSLYLTFCVSETDKDRLSDADYWYEFF